MAGLSDIAKEAGLNPAKIPEDADLKRLKNLDTSIPLEDFFNLIIAKCAAGETVRIKNFGTFRMRTMKGRTLKSPLMEGGEISFPDTQVLRFHQSQVAKGKLNELAPADEAPAKKATKKASKGKGGKKKVSKKAKK